MDRTAWIAVTLCVLALVAWEIWATRQRIPQPHAAATSTAPPALSASPEPRTANAATTPAPSPTATPAGFAEKTETLRNNDIELHLTNRGGGISEVVLPNYAAEEGKRVTLNSPAQVPIGAIMADPAAIDLPEFTMTRDKDAVAFESRTAEQLAIRKRIALLTNAPKDNFIAQLEIDFVNNGAVAYASPGYYLSVGSSAPIHRTDYPTYTRVVWLANGKTKGVDVGWFGASGGFLGVGARAPRPVYSETLKGAEWVASSNQFFTSLVAPLNEKADGVWARRFEANAAQQSFGVAGAMHLPAFRVEPGQTHSTHFELYLGPKLYHRLAQLDHGEAEVMEFGIFKIICQALLNALNTFHSFLGNYAAAILALTTTVKLALWPLQNRANASMRRMSALSPRMQELREKYKDDPTKMNAELMKLYKEHGVNPVGGCLPMFIQIPIFFGLFTMLRQAVELRGASFLWIQDLSQPDTVAHVPGLGWPINILPLIMAATSFWMTHLTPKSGDPTQQRMMMFTPIIFIIFCYNFAAALALYYTTQNLLTVLQLYVNKRQPVPEPVKVTTPAARAKKRR
ncbi:MAG: membrane protein insertase YidC [Chthoniobacterales bacterium]